MDTLKEWENFLTPAVMRERLVSTSLFITSYEMLKNSIMARLRDFFCIGFDDEGTLVSPEYQAKVLSLNKSPLYASLQWLQNMRVIDQNDMATFEDLKKTRNFLAHELPQIVLNGKAVDLEDKMENLLLIMKKIEVWWVLNVEIETDPDYDGRTVNADEITPGSIMVMQLMIEVIGGNTSLLERFTEERQKL